MASANNQSTGRKIWKLLTPGERRGAIGLLLLMTLGMVLETLGVGLVVPAMVLLGRGDLGATYPSLRPMLRALGNPDYMTLMVGGMLSLVLIYAIKTVFLAYLMWRQLGFAFALQARISQHLFTIYLHQPYTFHLQRNSAQLIFTIANEVSLFTFNGIQPGMLLLTEGLVLAGLFALLLFVEPIGALVVVGTLGLAAWFFYRASRGRLVRWGAARQHHESLGIQHLQQGLGGAKDVKVLGRETEFIREYSVHSNQSARVGQLQQAMQQLPRLWLELLAVSGLALLVFSMLFLGRDMNAVLPTLGLFAAAAFRFMPSVNRVLNSIQALRFGLPVIDLLHRENSLPQPPAQGSDGHKVLYSKALELRQIGFTYPGATRPALRDISLTIHAGESIGFVGASGAGKSTLVDILLGLLTPQCGKILVDGENLQNVLRSWQDQIGYVPQSIYLTDDTLRRNVAFGVPEHRIDDGALCRAIAAAQLEEFVNGLPEGFNTTVGERGIRLSGGQRQRIGIARALYHDPAVLVLDEATSSLDTATEAGVMAAVNALHGKKTIIIVAHRLSTVERCDRLYQLQDGAIVQQDTPKSLVQGRLQDAKYGELEKRTSNKRS